MAVGRVQSAGVGMFPLNGRGVIPLCRHHFILHTPQVSSHGWISKGHFPPFLNIPSYLIRTVHSPEDWDDGRNYNRAPMMRSGSLRHPPSGEKKNDNFYFFVSDALNSDVIGDILDSHAGPKTSSPLIQPLDNGDRHRPQPH